MNLDCTYIVVGIVSLFFKTPPSVEEPRLHKIVLGTKRNELQGHFNYTQRAALEEN